jgi:hypothetical protein
MQNNMATIASIFPIILFLASSRVFTIEHLCANLNRSEVIFSSREAHACLITTRDHSIDRHLGFTQSAVYLELSFQFTGCNSFIVFHLISVG